MARTKKNIASSRKQPASRRTRKVSVRRKSSMSSSRSTTRPIKAAGKSDRPLSSGLPVRAKTVGNESTPKQEKRDTPSARPSTSKASPPLSNSSRTTERPVARSLKPEPPKQDEESKFGTSPLLLGLAALLAGGLLWLGLSKDSEDAKPAASPAENAAAQMLEAPEEPVEPTPVAAPEPEAAVAASDTADTSEVESPAAVEPVQRLRRQVLAAKAKPATTTEEVLPESELGRFDRGAADGALTAAVEQASSCRQQGDPTGVAKVVVTFAPSGKVTAATINGPPFAGTKTGSCIARTVRSMNVPAFEGDHITIKKTVVIM